MLAWKDRKMDDFSMCGCTGIGLLWIAVHCVGLLVAWLVRLHAAGRFAMLVQAGFFVALLAVAALTIVGHVCCLEMWPLSALTLAVMIVMSIVDLGVSQPSAVRLER